MRRFANNFHFVTRENYWQIASRVTPKSLFTVTHTLFFISCEAYLPYWLQAQINPKCVQLCCSRVNSLVDLLLWCPSCTIEVLEWIINFISLFNGICDYLSILGLKLNYFSCSGPMGLGVILIGLLLSSTGEHAAKRECGYFCTASISESGLSYNPPNRRQAILWTSVDPIHWRILAALRKMI